MTLSGSCQCGKVNYTVNAEPLATYACHCTDCQKRTGSAFGMGMFLPAEALQLTGNLKEWQVSADSGNVKTRYSCESCGNVIYGDDADRPGLIKLQPGTLSDTSSVHAELHIWTRSAQPWIRFQDMAKQFKTQPEDALEFLSAAQSYRKSIEDSKA